jgi:hypothetical protein
VRQLSLTGLPFSLDTVRVEGRNPCRTPADSSAAVFALWDQARTAMNAVQLTSGSRGVGATLLTYERALDADRDRVVRQVSAIRSGLTRGIWNAATMDQLRRTGYIVQAEDGSTTYFAPDLNVLLSPAFLEDHCFKLETSRDPTRIGIAFEPVREERGIAGIRGTLWLDRRSSELRRMEFRYVNATREQQYGNAGGHIQFARTMNGAWMISGWNIRMPVLTLRQVRASGIATSGATVTEIGVDEIRVEGGELIMLTRNSDTLWTRKPFLLAGSVVDSTTGASVVGARVTLRGTGLTATTDPGGQFRLAGVLPGEYTVEVRTAALVALDAVYAVPFTYTDSSASLALRAPIARMVATTKRAATLYGSVITDVNGQPIAEAEIALAELRKMTFTNERGEYRLTDIPSGTHSVVVRKVGYQQYTGMLKVSGAENVERSFVLTGVPTLKTVDVRERANQAFEERRKLGLGKFLTEEDIDKLQGGPIATGLERLGGTQIIRSRSGRDAWLMTGRSRTSVGDGIWCPDNRADSTRGMRCGCYAQVYLDNLLLNPGLNQIRRDRGVTTTSYVTPPFDVNSIVTTGIEAVEWYSAPSQVPMEYNRRGAQCGVLVIHTRKGK